MKVQRIVELYLYFFLTWALDGVGGQRHAADHLPRGKKPGISCKVGCVGPRVGLDGCENRFHRDSIPGPSRPKKVAISLTLLRPQRYIQVCVCVCVCVVCVCQREKLNGT